jgi:hypothetical protein
VSDTELRAAAAAVSACDADRHWNYEDNELSGAFVVEADVWGTAKDMADAVLAANPADDGEPVSEEWLRSVGFRDGRMPGDLVCGPVVRGTSEARGVYWVVRTYPIPTPAAPGVPS